MKVGEGDKVVTVARTPHEEEAEEADGEALENESDEPTEENAE